MGEISGGLTAELYKAIITVVDDRVKEIKVTRKDFDELTRVVEELAQAQKKSEERLGRLETVVEELAQAQKKTEQRVEELAQAQKKTEQRVEELAQAQKKTEEEVRKLAVALGETRQMVSGLSATVGHRLEDEAYKSLPNLLRRDFQIEVDGRLIRKYVEYVDGKMDEINIYGSGKRNGEVVWILGECKAKLGKKDIDHFLKVVNRLERVLSGDKKVLVVVTYDVMPAVERYALEKGIKVYWSYEL
jgi:acyl transferase domain-containing protein